jgi:hypothetical protein
MDFPFFKILLMAVVLVLLIPIIRLVIRLLLRALFRRGLAYVGKLAMNQQPDRIHLTPGTVDDWEDPEAAEALISPLVPHGFQEAGTYTIEEMDGVAVRFLIQPEQCVVAAVCEHPQAGTWIDLVSTYPDDTSVTYTTSRPTGLEQRPGHGKVNAPASSSESLYERLLQERPTERPEEWTAANVAVKFEDAYARETAWRKNKGVSAEEVACQIPRMATAGTGASSE